MKQSLEPKIALLISFILFVPIIAVAFRFKSGSQTVEMGEPSFSQAGLYSKLDPVLGYAHDPGYQTTDLDRKRRMGIDGLDIKDIGNGFELMEYSNGKRPLGIVVLGACTSDSYLFGGNWPYRLHLLLKRKGIAHRIYNGSVSGYNSFQVLSKLERDVFSLPGISHVIYVGPNDAPSMGDVTPGHPAIHPYSEYLFRFLARGKFGILGQALESPRFSWLSRLVGVKTDDLQMGVENRDDLTQAAKNIRYMKAICDLNGVRFDHFLDVYAANQKQAESASWAEPRNESAEAETKRFYVDLEKKLKGLPYSHSLQETLPADQVLFYDFSHLNEKGSELIAGEIERTVFPGFGL